MKTDYQFVTFEDFCSSIGNDHPEYSVISQKRNIQLGIVRWARTWNKYAFWPDAGKILSEGCMIDIGSFIRTLPDERKQSTKDKEYEQQRSNS